MTKQKFIRVVLVLLAVVVILSVVLYVVYGDGKGELFAMGGGLLAVNLLLSLLLAKMFMN